MAPACQVTRTRSRHSKGRRQAAEAVDSSDEPHHDEEFLGDATTDTMHKASKDALQHIWIPRTHLLQELHRHKRNWALSCNNTAFHALLYYILDNAKTLGHRHQKCIALSFGHTSSCLVSNRTLAARRTKITRHGEAHCNPCGFCCFFTHGLLTTVGSTCTQAAFLCRG